MTLPWNFIVILTALSLLLTQTVLGQNESVAPDSPVVEDTDSLVSGGARLATVLSRQHEYQQTPPRGPCVAHLAKCSLSTASKAGNCCPSLECTRVGDHRNYAVCLQPGQAKAPEPTDSSKCPYTARIEQIIEPLRDGPEFSSTIDALERRKMQAITAAAYRGDRTRNYHIAIRNIHLAMRDNYRDMIREIGNNIYPLIVATDVEAGSVSGIGGMFSLYLEDGSVRRISPTSPEFEMLKNLAHLPLGLFTILSPHFVTPRSLPLDRLQGFQARVLEAIRASGLGTMTITNDLRIQGTTMLNMTNAYIVRWLAQGFVTVGDFETYTGEMFPYIEANIRRAATLQVQALLPVLKQWKDDLGDRWKDVYALIPTIWPVSAINPRMQVLAQLMSPEQVKTQVLLLENGGTLQDKRATLGRIVGDRAAALLILNTKTEAQRRLTFALSTKQDLLANSCADAITEYFKTNPRISLARK